MRALLGGLGLNGEGRRLLSEGEVGNLARRYRETGDAAAREALVAHFTPLVESVARQYARYGEPVEDLAQEGYIGLVKALDMFDPSRGVKFVTYATHLILGEIKHYLRDRTGVIREPGWLHDLSRKIARAADQLTQKHGRPPTVAEIAEHLGIDESQVQDVMRTRGTFRVGSLDAPADQEGERGIDLAKVETGQTGGLTASLPVEDRMVLEGAMGTLKRVEREVVESFFFRDLSQTEIARRLGISANYVSHLIRSSVGKLRDALTRQEHREASMQVRAALERRQAYLESVHSQAGRDPVTGLPSEAALPPRLDDLVGRALRYGHELGFALLEIERFGELPPERSMQVLADVANSLVSGLRKSDVVTRYGDAGFGIILPHTADVTERVVERLVRRVQRERVGARGPRSRSIALRGGIAVFPLDALAAEALLEAAQAALRETGPGDHAVRRAPGLRLEAQVLEMTEVSR